MLMGKFSFIISTALLIAALVTSLLPPKAVMADSQGKVYVCKYVGTPGVDERLQPGQNPIEVSVNTIPGPIVVGSYFPDRQGRSYVLGFVPIVPEPTRADCPSPSESASASITAGACSWTQEGGSLTLVTIVLSHASLTINDTTYTTSQTISLPPGSYPYTWKADSGYIVNGSETYDAGDSRNWSGSGTLIVGDCTPVTPSAMVTPGACSWTPESGSLTIVTIALSHASLKINGVTYTTSQTISLPPGTYPYTWKADPGYIVNGSGTYDTGDLKNWSGSGTLVIGDCSPGKASASVTIGACSWTPEGGSLTSVSIVLEHASLTINGVTYTTSQDISLPPGTYDYTWKADPGYTESVSGTDETGNQENVIGTDDTGNQGNGIGTVEPSDNWNESGTAEPGDIVNGIGTDTTSDNGKGCSGRIVIGDCTPDTASATVTPGVCSWTPEAGSFTPVTIVLSHASLKINGVTYKTSQTISLPPGTYPYSWKADSGYIVNGFETADTGDIGNGIGTDDTGDPRNWSGSGTLYIGDCTPGSASASVTPGACSWTPEDGSLTPVTLTLEHASLTIHDVTYTTSQTISLPPGSYPYSWTAESGYLGNGSGTVDVGDCTPGKASASVTTGACSWTQEAGSLTPVTLTLEHASLTINSGTYTTSQDINLAPGSYPYTWTAESGYIGNGSGIVIVEECMPGNASASVTTGACSWTQKAGSLTPVTLTLDHASLTINGEIYTTSQTISLTPGSYPYSWIAENGYIGKGSGTVVVGGCTPGTASASVTIGACSWSKAAGSLTPVTLNMSHASLTINGLTYTASQTISLPPGSYPYNWTAESGSIGNGSGTIVVGDCTPGNADASVSLGACSWIQGIGSLTPVTLGLSHASLTINGVTYTSPQTISLATGSYPYSWTAESGYIGNGSGTVEVGDCMPGTASASVTPGTCSWTQTDGSLTPVTLDLNHTSLTINGATYTTSQGISLAPGSYPYSWTAESGYLGNGSGTVVVGDCTPGSASASVNTGACSWTQETGSSTAVVLDLSHASLTIHGATYTTSQTISLAPGSYPYSWTAESGYIGNGSGTVDVGDCAPGSASASVTTGACSWTLADGSLTDVTLALSHATLTINDFTYTTSETISLAPGSYPYSWTAGSGYIGNGSGTIVIGDCTPSRASASVNSGVCGWTQEAGSLTPVTLAMEHAMLTINGVTYTTSQIISLPPGSYPYSWIAESGYIGSGSGTVNIGNCAPARPDASISVGICSWTQEAGSLTPVTLTLTGTALTINGLTYTTSQTISLAPGSYPYIWAALSGEIGSQSGTIVTQECPLILIPVSGVDMGLLRRILPGSLFGLSLSFAGLGMVLGGISRRQRDRKSAKNHAGD
jgi:hypothetical protein